MSQQLPICAGVPLHPVQFRLAATAVRISCACCVLLMLYAATGVAQAQETRMQNSFAAPRLNTSNVNLDDRHTDSLRRSLDDTRLNNSNQYERRRLTADERTTLRRELRESLKDVYNTPSR